MTDITELTQMKRTSMKQASPYIIALLAAALAVTGPVQAHGNAQHHKKASTEISTEAHAFGREGDPKRVIRTVNIAMSDAMRFSPSRIKIKQGDTIRFRVKNDGKVLHEMVIGTMEELKEHGELMKKNPDMEHDEPYMTHVQPGATQEMVWQFTQPGSFHFGCLVPGHFDAGMIGNIIVTKR